MATGLGALRLSPKDFWAMSPRELERATTGLFGDSTVATPPTRAALETLMHRYPDAID